MFLLFLFIFREAMLKVDLLYVVGDDQEQGKEIDSSNKSRQSLFCKLLLKTTQTTWDYSPGVPVVVLGTVKQASSREKHRDPQGIALFGFRSKDKIQKIQSRQHKDRKGSYITYKQTTKGKPGRTVETCRRYEHKQTTYLLASTTTSTIIACLLACLRELKTCDLVCDLCN